MKFLHSKVMIPPQNIDIPAVASTNNTVITTTGMGKELNLKVGGGDVVGELEDLILLRIDGSGNGITRLGKGS